MQNHQGGGVMDFVWDGIIWHAKTEVDGMIVISWEIIPCVGDL